MGNYPRMTTEEALAKIATEIEHLNWNLGKLVAEVTKNDKLRKALETEPGK
jgi:hypothetical protein